MPAWANVTNAPYNQGEGFLLAFYNDTYQQGEIVQIAYSSYSGKYYIRHKMYYTDNFSSWVTLN